MIVTMDKKGYDVTSKQWNQAVDVGMTEFIEMVTANLVWTNTPFLSILATLRMVTRDH